MDKRFQVFVSSTFKDLQAERQEVLQALLELDCIPSGMELFPAADEDQWSLIKKVISDCDYYIVVVAGRYGSLGPNGKSFTQMEYELATELGKPVIAFLHKDITQLPANLVEDTSQGRASLSQFRELCEKKVVRYWEGPKELGSVVSRSIVRLIKDRPAIGWVRADAIPSEDATKEMLRLRGIIDDLQVRLATARSSPMGDTSDLVQGDDEIEFRLSFRARTDKDAKYTSGSTYTAQNSLPFNSIFAKVSPLLMDESNEHEMKSSIDELISDEFWKYYKDHLKAESVSSFSIDNDSFQTIKVQLVALGLIEKGQKKRQIQDRQTYWKLTDRGELEMMRHRALRRTDDLFADHEQEDAGTAGNGGEGGTST